MAAHLVLVGMPGSGKSRAGALAARTLGRPFVDLDRVVEALAGSAVHEIFATAGEAGFRAFERAALAAALASRAPVVIATGAGIVLDPRNVDAMRRAALVVELHAPIAVLAARLGPERAERPLLTGGDLVARLEALDAARAPAYASARHHRVDAAADAAGVARAVADLAAREDPELRAATDGAAPGDFGSGSAAGASTPGSAARVVMVRLGARAYPVVVCTGGGPRRVAALAARSFDSAATLGVVVDPAARPVGDAVALALRGAGFRVVPIVELAAGEPCKTLDQAGRLVDLLVAAGLDRRSALVSIGGGATGDLCGFVASILYRGVAVAHVPTTLLAQVDAAIGGKTAVNRPAGKNLLGTFHQPRFVVADVSLLATLPSRELRAGLAEALKCGAVRDRALWDLLERTPLADVEGDPHVLADVVARSAAVKAEVVADDEYERAGARRLLNFGHTLGHAIESEAGHAAVRHGEAVALGMALAARVGERLGLSEPGFEARLRAAVARLGLPDDPDPWLRAEVLARVGADKKREGADVHFVVVRRPGEGEVVRLAAARIPELVAPLSAREVS